jgi:hypothetical protein
MRLNDKQLEMLKKAREILRAHEYEYRYDHRFICHQIYFADKGVSTLPEVAFAISMRTCSPEAIALVSGIEKAIEGKHTMESYLENIARVDSDLIRGGFAYLARLAWIDKILQTGEVV